MLEERPDFFDTTRKIFHIGVFDKQILEALGMESLRSGGQIIRDDRGWKKDAVLVESIWAARITPAFHPIGEIVMVKFSETVNWLFLLAEQQVNENKVIGLGNPYLKLVEIASWNDPVADALKSADIFPQNTSGQLDGISYFFRIRKTGFEADVSFGIPQTTNQRKIELALFEIGNKIADQSKDDKLKLYINTWKQYIRESSELNGK